MPSLRGIALFRLRVVRDVGVGCDRGREQERDRADREDEDHAPDRDHPLRVQSRVPGEPLGHGCTLVTRMGDAQ